MTNAAFPLIDNLTVEERQKRAEKDELSTVEMPLFLLDNVSTTKKLAEFNRTQHHQFQDMVVQRDDVRVQVILIQSALVINLSILLIFIYISGHGLL